MALSLTQANLLQLCEIPPEIQEFLARELGNQGLPLSETSPDFLDILSNLLQISENRLHNLRFKLGRHLNISNTTQGVLAEPTPEIITLEEEIKHAWRRAVALWRAANQVVHYPDDFGVKINIRHVHHALAKRNLPVVEMIRGARPEFLK